MPVTFLAISETLSASLTSAFVALGVAFIGFLQWRKTQVVETKKISTDSQDKFRDDMMQELNTVRTRMDVLMTMNGALMSEKSSTMMQLGQQQNQLHELGRRFDEAVRSREAFEQRVLELTKINAEQGKQINTLENEIVRLRTRIQELEKGNYQ